MTTAATPPVQFVTTSDGVSIACADLGGSGPPLIWTPGWVSHIEADWSNPDMPPLYRRLAANHRLVHFDGRGTGLSDRQVDDLSAAARSRDIEAVVNGLKLESFDLLGWSSWGPPAIIYAAEHADRVRRLALYATFATAYSERKDLAEALLALIRAEWSVGSRTITEFVYPNVNHELEEIFTTYFRTSSSGEVAATILEEGLFHVDVTAYLSRLTMPTGVLHRREDPAVSFARGRQLASLVQGARFLPLTSRVHVPWHGDVDGFVVALEGFLGVTPAPATAPAAARRPTAGPPVTLLFTDMEGSTALTQRLGDEGAQELVRAHNQIVRDALSESGGTEIKHTGDGIMASFPAASSAIESAISIQRAAAARALDSQAEAGRAGPAAGLRIRIGLNAGEPVAEDEDLFGTAVQLAARIRDRAAPDQILASNVVRELAAGKGFSFSDEGDVELRGFEEPVRLHAVRWEE